MKKLILAFSAAALLSSFATKAQDFKFGVNISPQISFLGSNDNDVLGDGANFGFRIGVTGEYFIADNYSLTSGLAFSLNRGGTLKYEKGGILLPNSELDTDNYKNNAGQAPTEGENMRLSANTTVKYKINYFEVPIGFKMRTNELGDSYLRAFAHLPVLNIGVVAAGRANVDAPNDLLPSSDIYAGSGEKEIITRDIVPINLTLGGGLGVEWAPNDEEGVRIIGGIYYQAAILDATKRFSLTQDDGSLREENPAARLNTISLRVGVLF